MQPKILYIFTRTPLHVGAGASVGAIDQPVQRERHTGFPVIPASSLKGSFVDEWPGERIAFREEETDGKKTKILDQIHPAGWLFGSDTTDLAFAGSLIFSEARVLAFPIRSARGSYAWITCPLMLQRAKRDGVFAGEAATEIENLKEPADSETDALAICKFDPLGLGDDKKQIVLEEYCLTRDKQAFPTELAKAIAKLVADDLFASVTDRLASFPTA